MLLKQRHLFQYCYFGACLSVLNFRADSKPLSKQQKKETANKSDLLLLT